MSEKVKQITPVVNYIGQTGIDYEEMQKVMESLGVPDWNTDASDDASYLTEFAGKSCYMSFDTSLNKNLTRTGTRDNETYIQEGIVGMHHGSVLEHSVCNFFIKDVSRVVTHELVRHRAGTAFSQVSGRYVRADVLEFYVPEIFSKYEGATEKFVDAMKTIKGLYEGLEAHIGIDSMKDFSEKKKLTSAMRRILPNGQANHIVFSANHRALRHIIAERTSPHAEEEIRVVFAQIAALMKERHPAIYADMEVGEDGLEYTFKNRKV